jgi:hypothetical protein
MWPACVKIEDEWRRKKVGSSKAQKPSPAQLYFLCREGFFHSNGNNKACSSAKKILIKKF